MKRNALIVWFVLIAISFIPARAAESSCPSCDVSEAKKEQYNQALLLTPAQKKTAESKHVAYGLPVPAANATHEHLLQQKDYLIWYDDDLRVPLWVSYKLTKKQISTHRARTECFRPDPRLSAAQRAECDDYSEPRYDQGHLAPNADFTQTEEMMVNTYLYSNMTPQEANFNRHTWERLEETVRGWCDKYGDLYVISGAVFDRDGNGQRDKDEDAQRLKNHVAIPTHFYKIIFNKHLLGADQCIAILLPHDNAKHTGGSWEPWIVSHITTVGEIEKLTGINFLATMSASKRAQVENFKATTLWPKD
jgi:DNA/RNA endonuclease G (NUC1)